MPRASYEGYDIIGDLHGHADALKQLLDRLGYQHRQGRYQHPERQVIFLGDFIDRGPQQLEVLRIVQDMVLAGSAQAVMGNHELNALGWYFADDQGQPLRPHTDKNRQQHQAFLEEVGEGSAQHHEWIEWFLTLPLWLKQDDLQLVHACWCETSMQTLRPLLNEDLSLQDATFQQLFEKGHPAYTAAETLLKGVEIELPDGHSFKDKDGNERFEARLRWWLADEAELSLPEAAILPPEQARSLPDLPVAEQLADYREINQPTFVGHYWLRGTPEPLTNLIACLDYSIGKGGQLVAYRYDGEAVLDQKKFIAHC